ncbi:MAG: M48 family metallopeptidase [Acholeplasmataceae bacterium]
MVLILSLLSGMFIIKLVIDILNYKHSIQKVPKNTEHIYDEEAYQKWLNYNRDQMKFSLISKSFNFVVLMLFFIFKIFGVMEALTIDLSGSIYIQTLLFMGIYFILSNILSIPFEYYSTFVIEERHGFNKSTKKTFWIDQLKEFILGAVLFGALIFGLQALYITFVDQIWIFILLTWIALSVIMIIMFILNVKVFVKLFNKLTPLEDGTLKTKIDELAKNLGFEIDKISVMDASKRSTKLNAFFSGLGKHRDVVLYDTLIDKMGEDEILAVLGHELSHALNKDTTKMLFQQIVVFGIFAVIIGGILNWTNMYTAFGLSGIHFGFTIILFSVLAEPLNLLLGLPTNYMSRVAEYRADRFGAKHVSKESMIHALEVLAKENFSNLNPHPLYVVLYYNHPTISQRIDSILAG